MRKIHYNFCLGVADNIEPSTLYAYEVNWQGYTEIALLRYLVPMLPARPLYAIRVKPKVQHAR